MNRKDFIKLAAMSVGGFYFANSTFSFAHTLRKIEYNKKDIQHFPIIIIGSGYGGAVSALRLCEAGKKVVLLELGVGFNTPIIIRFPFEKMVRENSSYSLIRLNMDEAVVPESFGKRAIGIEGDMERAITDIRGQVL